LIFGGRGIRERRNILTAKGPLGKGRKRNDRGGHANSQIGGEREKCSEGKMGGRKNRLRKVSTGDAKKPVGLRFKKEKAPVPGGENRKEREGGGGTKPAPVLELYPSISNTKEEKKWCAQKKKCLRRKRPRKNNLQRRKDHSRTRRKGGTSQGGGPTLLLRNLEVHPPAE